MVKIKAVTSVDTAERSWSDEQNELFAKDHFSKREIREPSRNSNLDSLVSFYYRLLAVSMVDEADERNTPN